MNKREFDWCLGTHYVGNIEIDTIRATKKVKGTFKGQPMTLLLCDAHEPSFTAIEGWVTIETTDMRSRNEVG